MIYIYKTISKILESSKRKTLNVCDIIDETQIKLGTTRYEIQGGYEEFALMVEFFCTQGILSPVKSSGIYPRNPPLALRYRINIEKMKSNITEGEKEKLRQELMSVHPILKKGYYLKDLELYNKDRTYILKLNNYLSNYQKNKTLKDRYTLNERSFEVFNDEKYLSQYGETLLKRLGISFEDLNCYKTYEAFFYISYYDNYDGSNSQNYCNNCYAQSNTFNQYNALIIENKDTFMSIMKLLNRNSGAKIGGKRIHLLIYGEGKKIINSFKFMDEITREHTIDNIFYFGDIDYEGIGIFQGMQQTYSSYNIIPHTELYGNLIANADSPPKLKTKQEKIKVEGFLKYFDEYYSQNILRVLEARKYIPQEAYSFGREG